MAIVVHEIRVLTDFGSKSPPPPPPPTAALPRASHRSQTQRNATKRPGSPIRGLGPPNRKTKGLSTGALHMCKPLALHLRRPKGRGAGGVVMTDAVDRRGASLGGGGGLMRPGNDVCAGRLSCCRVFGGGGGGARRASRAPA